MQFFKKYLVIAWHGLKTYRLTILVFFLLFGLFLFIRFPYEKALSFALDRVFRQGMVPVQLYYDSVYISPIGPAIVFNHPRIQIDNSGKYLKLEQIKVSPNYRSLLSLRPGLVFIFKWSQNEALVSVRKTNWGSENLRLVFAVKANFNPSVLRSAWPLVSKLSGVFYVNTELIWEDTGGDIELSGFWSVQGGKIHVKALSYTFPGTIGTISLPSFHWSRFHSNGRIHKNSIMVSDLSIGGLKDIFQLKTRGIYQLGIVKKSFSPRPSIYLKSYDIGLDILVHEDLKTKLYFLDLILSSVEKKNNSGSRYLARIKGNRVNFFNISSVSDLPTLKDIQNPSAN